MRADNGVNLALLLTALCLAASAVLASEDLRGSEDLPGMARFPGSWIVAYERGEETTSYEWILGPVTKSGAFVRPKDSLRLRGRVTKVTYRIPSGVTSTEAFAHFRSAIVMEPGSRAFVCQGRDCGRSQHWASGIFKQPTLYGPDQNQFYLAAPFSHRGEARLLSIYVIQRGNRRVYAHLELLSVDEVPALTAAVGLAAELNRNGYAIIQGALIGPGGAVDLEPALRDVLRGELAGLVNRRVYVVCHLYGPGDPDGLIEASKGCATNFVEALGDFRGPAFVTFGAGPLFARHATAKQSHLELVIP